MALACVAARPEFEFPEADEKDKKIPISMRYAFHRKVPKLQYINLTAMAQKRIQLCS